MALTAAVATAVAAVCAGSIVGVPPWLMAVFLLPGVGLVAVRPDRPGIPAGVGSRQLLWALVVAVAILYLSGIFGTIEDFAQASWLLVVAVVPISLMWPAPAILRFCVLLVAGGLVGTGTSLDVAGWRLAGVVVASAVALVAVHRSSRTGATAAATSPGERRRQVGRESAVLFVVAGLIALIVASVLDPPPGSAGGNEPMAGEVPRGQPGELPPYLHPVDALDAGGQGDGEGREVVFRVRAEYSSLWRTMTFDTYDGRTWTRSPELEPGRGAYEEGTAFIPPGIGQEEAEGDVPLDQRVRVETGSVGVLPAAPEPFAVRLTGGVQVAGDSTIYAVPYLGKGATYTVTSFLPAAVDSLADADGTIPFELRRLYLEYPAIPARVAELGTRLTAGAGTRHDKVLAVQAWMADNTRFRRGTDPLAPDEDPVDRFLFDDRGGSSQQAASAMAVLLRSAGVPAWVAVGYLPGDRSAFGDDFVVRARHAATWVEVWFPTAGWVPFDPTMRFLGPEPVDDSLLDRLGRLLRALWWVGVLVALALAAWLVMWILRRRRARRARPWATRCYERLRRAGARYDRPHRPHETPAEYCDALAATVPDDRLARVGDLLTVAASSNHEPPAVDRAWADAVVTDLERRAPRRRPGGRPGPHDTHPPPPVPAGGSRQAPG